MTESLYYNLLLGGVVFLALAICACLLRAILGPRFTDRIVAISLICTKSIIAITVLAFLLDESFLLDVAIVYAMIGFLAVVVLSKCYLLPHRRRPVDTELEAENIHRHSDAKTGE